MKTERCQTQALVRACSWSVMALVESEFHRADVLVGAELGLIVAALAPDIRGTLDAEFVCNKGDVIIAIEAGSASELVRRLSGYPDLVRAAPPMQAGAPGGSPGDSAARLLAANGFEIEPRLWSELSGLARSNSSVARGYAL
jgi:LDH2 family malate/lactate/ureidoglycolate dehydrogenase